MKTYSRMAGGQCYPALGTSTLYAVGPTVVTSLVFRR